MAKRSESHRPKLINLVIEAISPMLIIGMICCLVYFLVVAFYRGEFDLRLMYILGLFTLGVVFIARIAIESGRSYANGFAIPLAIVTVLAMMRFVTVQGDLAPLSWLFNIGLLALIWFLADRITFDCTLDDRKRRIKQEGLLQTLRLVKRPPEWSTTESAVGEEAATHVLLGKPVPFGKQDVLGQQDVQEKQDARKHNPGVWVLRFALLALPLFGLGQLIIADAETRGQAFWFLFGYLAFALCLLVCTSLLSVRRYLFNRGAEMPAEVASIWLGSGTIGVLMILAICILLPLPGRTLGLIELPFGIASPEGLLGSRFGWGSEGTTDEQNPDSAKSQSETGDPTGAPEPDGQGPAQASDNASKNASQVNAKSGEESDSSGSQDSPSGTSQQKNTPTKNSQPKQPGQGKQAAPKSNSKDNPQPPSRDQQRNQPSDEDRNEKSAEQPPADAQSDQVDDQKAERQQDRSRDNKSDDHKSDGSKSNDGKSSEGKSSAGKVASQRSGTRQGSSSLNNMLHSFNSDFASLFKWATVLILVLFVVIYAIMHPREVAQLLRDIVNFFAALFGRKPVVNSQANLGGQQPASETKRGLAPFSSYANPFQSGEQLSGVYIVERTFAALESWAAEAGVSRLPDETSREFVARLVASRPRLGKHPVQAANMLDQVMFAGWKPTISDLQPLEQLWRSLTN